MNMQVTQDVLDALKSARQVPNDDLAKNFTQSSSAISSVRVFVVIEIFIHVTFGT